MRYWKTENIYYTNLNEKDCKDNKQFWQTVKPLFSGKIKLSGEVTLAGQRATVENGGNVGDELMIIMEKLLIFLIDFLQMLQKNLEFNETVSLADKFSHLFFKVNEVNILSQHYCDKKRE